MTDNGDAFESAAAAASAEIEPTVRMEDDHETENESTEETLATPARRPRGRPRGRGRRRRTSTTPRNRSVNAKGSDGDVQPSKSVARTEVQAPVVIAPLPPEKLIPFLRQIDKAFIRLLGTSPLDEQELKDGAEACAPVLDHYAPLFLSQPWAPAAIWAGMVYVPRAVELYDRRKAGGGRKSDTFPVSSDPTAQTQTAVG